MLERTLASIWAFTTCDYEIVIVDGASEDATPQVIRDACMWAGDRIRLVQESRDEGFVRAANKGFAAATGRHVMWLNDNARPGRGSLDRALALSSAAEADVALLAAYHRPAQVTIAHEATYRGQRFVTMHLRGTLYANFGIGRRDVLERLGFFDERFYVGAADADLSLKAWDAGLRVIPAEGVFIDHAEHADARFRAAAADAEQSRLDEQTLFEKWNLPTSMEPAAFDPARPCMLGGPREPLAEAA
jgi:GT2 family glycosyltransferase